MCCCSAAQSSLLGKKRTEGKDCKIMRRQIKEECHKHRFERQITPLWLGTSCTFCTLDFIPTLHAQNFSDFLSYSQRPNLIEEAINMTTFKSILILFWLFSKYSVKYFLLSGGSNSFTAYIYVNNISCGIEKKASFRGWIAFLPHGFPSLLTCLQAASKRKECCPLLLCLLFYLVLPHVICGEITGK